MNWLPPSNRHNLSLGLNSGVHFPTLSGNVYRFADPGLARLRTGGWEYWRGGQTLAGREGEGQVERKAPPPPKRRAEERRAKEQQQDGPVLPVGTIEAWLEKRAKRLRAAQRDSPHSEEEVVFQYPPGWPPVQELPPSLRAPPLGGWTAPPGLHWG
ncbi:zinc finger matrin-type protein 5 isoform 2-T6 [Vipera latastei]